MSATETSRQVAIVSSLTEDQATVVAEVMQPTLVDLIDLALNFKQLHWAVYGPRFKQVHEHLDVLVDFTRTYSDLVAEYLSTVGITPDGRAVRVAADARDEPPSNSFLTDDQAIEDATQRLERFATELRSRSARVAGADSAAEDVLIEIQREADKQLWMTSAHR
jgi:starvation-inducible DNA-binding protein